jgi:UDP-glucose 4-epimerase
VAREHAAGRFAIDDPRYRYEKVDLLRQRQMRSLLWGPAREVDTIVHGAMHRSALATGPRAHRLNVDCTRELLAMAEDHPTIERFVFASSGGVYRVDNRQPSVIDEDQPLNLDAGAPQWVRDRIAADLVVCMRMGMSRLRIAVLRFAECLARDMGSQLYDYLSAPVCFRPLGFDPILNVISLEDMAQALVAAVVGNAQGLYNVPGRDTLPLSEAIRRWGHNAIPAPGPLMAPMYRLRALFEGSEFRYDLNHWRFHYNGVLSGRRAADDLGYQPRHGIEWPVGGALPA